MNNIEQEALKTYKTNLLFLENKYPKVYEQIALLSSGLEMGTIKENYQLEYMEDDYFDIYSVENDSYLYNIDSNKYTKKIVSEVSLDEYSGAFHTLFKDPSILKNVYGYLGDVFDYINDHKSENKKYNLVPKFFFLGVLLGMHIPKILEKLSVKRCFIYEENLEVFRLSLFTTKYYNISEYTTLDFSLMEDTLTFKKNFNHFIINNFNLNYAIKFHALPAYDYLLKEITAMISSSQAYRMDFLRRLNTYKQTLEKAIDNDKLVNLLSAQNLLKNDNVLVLGSGPSMDNNIEWLKEHQNNFIIISVGANLPVLLKHGIKPDITVEVHPEGDSCDSYKDLDLREIDDVLFLAGGQVQKQLLSKYNPDNTFIFFTLLLIRTELGGVSGLSVGNIAIYLGLIFEAKNLYLLGIDFALSDDGLTHNTSHVHVQKVNEVKEIEIESKNVMHEKDLFPVKGNFKEKVLTNSIFYKFLESANSRFSLPHSSKVYNLANGAYIENTTPLLIEDIKIEKKYDKNLFKKEFKSKLNDISVCGLSDEDKKSFEYMIKFTNELTNEYKGDDIRGYFNDIIKNDKLNNAYREMILNYMQNIFHYVDGFLNDAKFTDDIQKEHLKEMDKLLYKNFVKLTTDFKDMIEKGIDNK